MKYNDKLLKKAYSWLIKNSVNSAFRLVVVLNGKNIIEWNEKYKRSTLLPIYSAAKSIYSNILGIAEYEKKINSIDEKVFKYYPEFLDVKDGEGPKENRYAFDKDKDITFRHLISNMSGYMKPGEIPGKVFHYQTYGMNILTHALAKIYGYQNYSTSFNKIIEEKIAKKIGVNWKYEIFNFKLHSKAKLSIFGNSCLVKSTAEDMARLGWLWCNFGKWKDMQIIPEKWMRISTKTSELIISNCSKEEWKYGMGFWANDYRKLWPNLPKNSFQAWGIKGQYISVFPDYNLVIVQSPGPDNGENGNPILLDILLNWITRINY